MAQASNIKAAEHHETVAKSHRAAAGLHGKKNDKEGLEHATKAHGQSKSAHKASAEAHGKSTSASK